jgi:hypothetical protein
VSKFIEAETGWSIKKFVRTARRYRTIEIQTGAHTITPDFHQLGGTARAAGR